MSTLKKSIASLNLPVINCSLTATLTGINLFYDAVNVPDVVNFDSNVLSTGVGNAMGLSFITGPSSRRVGLTLKATF